MSKNSWWKQSGVERRDERASKDTPEASSKGKRSPKKKPWVVEFMLPKRDVDVNHWTPWKYDGEWHNYTYRRYATQKDALKAMNAESSKVGRSWHFQDLSGISWRIRNTEE
jgi:hypothetical protein